VAEFIGCNASNPGACLRASRPTRFAIGAGRTDPQSAQPGITRPHNTGLTSCARQRQSPQSPYHAIAASGDPGSWASARLENYPFPTVVWGRAAPRRQTRLPDLQRGSDLAVVGYARVSTEDQSTEGQILDLQKFGCAEIFRENASGTVRYTGRCFKRWWLPHTWMNCDMTYEPLGTPTVICWSSTSQS
jgi:hypothetical protein